MRHEGLVRVSTVTAKLVLVVVLATLGGAISSFYYMDLTEGPFANHLTVFEQPGYDAADCYHSPEAHMVGGRATIAAVTVVPLALLGGIVLGAGLASRRSRRRDPAGIVEARPRIVDGVVLASASPVLSAVVTGFVYGYDIRRLLDPGCTMQPVPGPVTTAIVGLCVAAAAVLLGLWTEQGSAVRRMARQVSRAIAAVPPRPVTPDDPERLPPFRSTAGR